MPSHCPDNVSLYENSTVLGINQRGGFHLELALGGNIQADKVMLCTNFEARSLGHLQNSGGWQHPGRQFYPPSYMTMNSTGSARWTNGVFCHCIAGVPPCA